MNEDEFAQQGIDIVEHMKCLQELDIDEILKYPSSKVKLRLEIKLERIMQDIIVEMTQRFESTFYGNTFFSGD